MKSAYRPFAGMIAAAAAVSAPPRFQLNVVVASGCFSGAHALNTLPSLQLLPRTIVSLVAADSRAPHSSYHRSSAHAALFSTPATEDDSDADLLEFIHDDIKATEEEHVNMAKGFRDDFPFSIDDDEKSDFITLKRSYKNEAIQVKVFQAEDEAEDENTHAVDKAADDECLLKLYITISKDKGRSLEFECTTYKDRISIDDMYFQDHDNVAENEPVNGGSKEGPDFSELDENMRKGFLKYLQRRAVSTSVADFLYNYMLNRENRNYLRWLNQLKQFIQK